MDRERMAFVRSISQIQEDADIAIRYEDSDRLLELATEFESLGDAEALIRGTNLRAIAAINHGELGTAIELYRQVMAFHDRNGNVMSQVTTLNGLGICHFLIGDLRAAERYYLQALQLIDAATDLRASEFRAIIHGNLGNVARQSGDNADALRQYHRALDLHRDGGDSFQEALNLGNIAATHLSQSSYVEARSYADRALDLCRALNDHVGVAETLQTIAMIERVLGHHSEALSLLKESLALFEQQDLITNAALARYNIGTILQRMNDLEGAISAYISALNDAQKTSNVPLEQMILVGIASAEVTLDRLHDAEQTLLRVTLSESTDRSVVMTFHAVRASIHAGHGRFDDAKSELTTAIEIGEHHAYLELLIECHTQLRSLAQEQGDFTAYILHNEQIIAITEKVHGKAITEQLVAMQSERTIEAERREREKERALLYGTLPKNIADRMIKGERITGDHYDDACVLFLDIVDFTTIANDLSAPQVVQLLEKVFSAVDEICRTHHVTKVKTIGDSYMAVALPVELENSEQRVASPAKRTAHAALDILSIFSPEGSPSGPLQVSFRSPSGPLQVRIGIHSGPVTAGVIGTERLQYDVWGDTVNVASRMESSGQPGRIHVSESFASSLAPGTWHIKPRGVIEIKGKGMMTTFWLEEHDSEAP